MIQLICFDLDDTLMDFHKGEEIAFYETMKEENIEASMDDYLLYKKINGALWKKLEKGEVERYALQRIRFEELKKESRLDFDVEKVNALFPQKLSEQAILLEDSVKILEWCSKKAKLALASNGTASIQYRRIEKAGIKKYFEYIFISEEVGYAKPHPAYFDAIFKSANVSPKEVLFIGDSLSADMNGAVESGCISVWFNPKHIINDSAVIPDHEIDRLSSIIDRWEEFK
ncbi:YjjG family noncanonical pyrimidine nucleotidase [uncultured Traorella sp.]|uniref:YjjG family noncanonical pyrimidine nucleotidase n=1 Tax=uncultured Traorella sp. TaxID=1929048 RepID=UPI0025D68F76|nr:YjjG family noncanonical pyrimidine nucleotidase [uncultured Traorella sp.]